MWTDQTTDCHFSMVITLVQDDSCVAGRENEDVEVGAERVKCRFSDLERLGC